MNQNIKEKDPDATEPCMLIYHAVSSLLAEKGPPEAIKEKYKEAQIPLKEHSNTLPSIGIVAINTISFTSLINSL